MENERISLPVVALRGMTILPEMVAHFDVSREKSLQAIDQAMTEGEKIFLTGQYEIETEDPDVTDRMYCNNQADCEASEEDQPCSGKRRAESRAH